MFCGGSPGGRRAFPASIRSIQSNKHQPTPAATEPIASWELKTMPKQIMIIRHAEKPDAQTAGVSLGGEQDDENLTVRGWQRSGALVRFFAPAAGSRPDTRVVTPQFIFASGTGPHSKSLTSIPS